LKARRIEGRGFSNPEQACHENIRSMGDGIRGAFPRRQPARAGPQLINYQARVAVGGVNFDGPGQFKFALVN
jgi:hypothetical protein